MFRIGAHVSMAGGVDNAIDREIDVGGNCGQIFVGSPRGWAVNEIDPDEAEAFRIGAKEQDVGPWIVHGTYLVNLATPKDDLGKRSLETVQAEIDSAAALDIPYYVFHPGAHTGAGVEQGVENVARRLSALDIPDGLTVLLENTAGRGTTVGKSFGELDTMITESDCGYGELGVCLDTCHLFAAGYDFTTDAGMAELVEELETEIGTDHVAYLHLNDSKHPLGSNKDEHQHLGEGEIGEAGFHRFINHEALRDNPMVVETPDENDKGFAWNINRARTIRED